MWLQVFILINFSINSFKCLSFIPNDFQETNLQVELPYGIVQGREYDSDEHGSFYGFQGIPYAAPPINDLRFRGPQEPMKWHGVLNATKDSEYCAQYHDGYSGSEDCLYINIYTKKLNSTDSLPVMVWIYGGAFYSGSSRKDLFGPDYLVQKDVIVVTFNYRVGIFGFLSTDDMSSPGNYGLKDQIAALRFVNRNIHLFGGDSKRITIFGESAGAASVSYLLLAPKAANLFQNAISESGTALCPWAFQRKPKSIALQIAFALGVTTLDTNELVTRFRQIPYDVLLTVSSSVILLNAISPLNGLAFSPTIEPIHEDAILTEGSHELFKTGRFNRVPCIIGFNSEESSVIQEMIRYIRPYLLLYDLFPTTLVPTDMNVPRMSLNNFQVANHIKYQYFGLTAASKAPMKDILSYISDTQFVKPILETIRLMSKYAPIYLYQFSYEGETALESVNLDKIVKGTERVAKGVGHSEEMWYLWKRKNITVTGIDELKSFLLISLWTNFAKFQTPTPPYDSTLSNITWVLASSENNYRYLDIGPELQFCDKPKNEVIHFWEKLYAYYGKPPFDTY